MTKCHERIQGDAGIGRLAKQYQQAVSILSSETVRCLRIVDSNTIGLKGEKFTALVRQEGRVDKDSTAPGGSFGIGKNAPFNASGINTVFYSTRYNTARGRHEQMEGKALLIPHGDPFDENPRPEVLQHAGYYRKSDRQSIEGREIHDYFRLEDTGTGVFVIGFDPKERDWANDAVDAVLNNFAYSVRHRMLRVVISTDGNAHTIDHRSLEQVFDQQRSNAAQSRNEEAAAKLERAYQYYLAYRDSQQPTTAGPATHLGEMNVWVNATGGPRQTLYINRNGMVITDARADVERNPFGPRNKQTWPEYAAVVMPTKDSTDELIRRMENPSHDQINIQSLETGTQRNQMAKACNHIRGEVAKIIEAATGVAEYAQASNAEEMRRFVPEQTSEKQPEGIPEKALRGHARQAHQRGRTHLPDRHSRRQTDHTTKTKWLVQRQERQQNHQQAPRRGNETDPRPTSQNHQGSEHRKNDARDLHATNQRRHNWQTKVHDTTSRERPRPQGNSAGTPIRCN